MELCNAKLKNIYWKINEQEQWDKYDIFERTESYHTPYVFFVWNNYKREMVPFEVIGHIYNHKNNEYLQSAVQGYKFTFMDHLYEKNKIYYKYNYTTATFYEIKFDSI